MPLFLFEDEGKKFGDKQFIFPDYLVKHLQELTNTYKDNDNFTKSKGYERLMSYLNDDYNSPSDKKDRQHNDKHTISFADLKRLDFDFDHMPQDSHNPEYVLAGGDLMRNWAKSSLSSLRNSVKKVKSVPEVPKLDKTKDLKVEPAKNAVKVSGVEVDIHESFNKKISKRFK